MKFSSKFDILNTIFFVLACVLFVFTCVILFITGEWVAWGIMVFILVMMIWLFFSISIILFDDKMSINIMFFKKNIKYSDIKEVLITRNIWSSFATSFRRIGIRTSDTRKVFKYVYISPDKEEVFLSMLKNKVSENVIFRNDIVKE